MEKLINEIDEEILKVTEPISQVMEIVETNDESQMSTQDKISSKELLEKLNLLIQALDSYDSDASIMIKELKKHAVSDDLVDELNKVDELIEDYELDAAVEICRRIVENIKRL